MGLDNPLHVALLVVLLLLVFGAKRLPEMGRSIGAGMREFKDSVTGATPALTQTTPQPPQQMPMQPSATQPAAQPVAAPPIGGQAPAQPVAAPAEPAPAPVEPAHQG
jgi:sec-independent protein translocase protein TatA